jgi:hypothetical protein
MLTLHDVPALAPDAHRTLVAPADDDWLSVPEQELHDAHAEACRLLAATGDEASRLRHARSVILLEQLLAARAAVRAGAIPASEARAALQGHRALGYFMGLAASGGDPTAAPATERAFAAALRHVHGLVFGMAQARLATEACPDEPLPPFGDGVVAAEADLHGFFAAAAGGPATLPVGLLRCLPRITARAGGDPTARPH